MNIIIDDVRPGLTIIDKDNSDYAKGNEILNLKPTKFHYYDKIRGIAKIIARLNQFSECEYFVYLYTITDIINDESNMVHKGIIKYNKDVINAICRKYNISPSSVRRAIVGLNNKGVLTYINSDSNITSYTLNKDYDISAYYDNDIQYITIKI